MVRLDYYIRIFLIWGCTSKYSVPFIKIYLCAKIKLCSGVSCYMNMLGYMASKIYLPSVNDSSNKKDKNVLYAEMRFMA